MWELHGTQLPCVTAVWQGLVWPKAGCNVSLSCTGCQGLSFQETNQKMGMFLKNFLERNPTALTPLVCFAAGGCPGGWHNPLHWLHEAWSSQPDQHQCFGRAGRAHFVQGPFRYFDQTLVHLYLWSTFILDYFVDSKLEYIFPVLYKKWHRDISYLGGLFLRQETLKYKEVWWSWFHRCWLELMPLVPFVGTSGQDMVKHNTYISIHKHIIWFQGGVSTIQAQSGSWSIHKHYQTL